MEWRILLGALLGAWGWWAGGRGLWPGKAWRRFLLPVALGVLLSNVLPWQRLLLGVGLMMTANSLPYGEHHRLRVKMLTALSLGGCLAPFGLSFIQMALVPMWFLLAALISRLDNDMSWAGVEVGTGAIQGLLAGMAQ